MDTCAFPFFLTLLCVATFAFGNTPTSYTNMVNGYGPQKTSITAHGFAPERPPNIHSYAYEGERQSNIAYGAPERLLVPYANTPERPSNFAYGYGSQKLLNLPYEYGPETINFPYGLSPDKATIGYGTRKPGITNQRYSTPRPDFSNEPSTTLPPLTQQQQVYLNMMNVVIGNSAGGGGNLFQAIMSG